ncbi:uncharacterized protein LOC120552998 [Perca fluviatilis]|nr:uncharacterized protein LOC120552998 [Perca fluviatilis]
MSSFEIPWQKMPANLRQCVAQGLRPRKQEHLSMVRIIVQAIQEKCLNPTRNQCSEIARQVIEKHPKSFADVTAEGEIIGCGYGSLLNQIKTRIDHVNRDNTLVRVRRPKQHATCETASSNESPIPSKCSKTDSYGCVNWHPIDLPQGETPESVEGKRKQMVELFSVEGPRAAERAWVEEYMIKTYASQRYTINANPPPGMDEIQEKWPFLFLKRFLCNHFATLTGIDIDARFVGCLGTKGKKILHFFQSQLARWNKEVRKVLQDIEKAGCDKVNHGVACTLTTMAFFKEDVDALFLPADVTATAADINSSLSAPSTPRLIALGDSVLEANGWMLTVDGKVIIGPQELPDFDSALAALFSCFYSFNIQYQTEAENTLEFIQRFIVRINPEGSKCKSRTQISRRTGKTVQRKNANLNPVVAAFIRELVDFEWQNY